MRRAAVRIPGHALLLLLLAPPAAAQSPLPLKRELPPTAWHGCPVHVPAAVPPDTIRQRAARLMADARQAALLGDAEAVHRSVAQAAALDPSSPELAYRLAQSLEQLGRRAEALREYCRFLALEPDSPDSDEVRGRVPDIVAALGTPVSAAAADAYARGIEYYDGGRFDQAEHAFGQAAGEETAWSAPLYNRALARFAAGRSDAALDDLRRYLELDPEATDLRPVLDVMLAFGGAPRRSWDPEIAFATGMLVPGLGHFTTGRPGTGALVLGAAAGIVGTTFSIQRVEIVCRSPVEDGVCPPADVLDERKERPYATMGIAAAVAVGVLGAVDAYRGARRRQAAEPGQDAATRRSGAGQTGALPPPGRGPGPRGRSSTGASLLPPALAHAGDAVQVQLVRIRF